MYKVFVNEKKLLLSKFPENVEKQLKYEGVRTLEIAVDLLQNTSCKEINVYSNNLDALWNNFSQLYKNIVAAGGIVHNNEGEILFIYRLGKWDLPKGKIEPNETKEQAAIREIKEETGLKDLVLEHPINDTFHIYKDRYNKNILKITHWYKIHCVGDTTTLPQTEEGITQAAWKNDLEIKEVVFPSTFKNIQLILTDYWKMG